MIASTDNNNTMKAAVVVAAGKWEIKQIPIPQTTKGQVRVKVMACGVCYSDSMIVSGRVGPIFPRVPGHEIAGIVDALGEGVTKFKIGDRVGVGFFGGGHCGECTDCLSNSWVTCKSVGGCGISFNGGFAEYTVAPQDALSRIPDEIDFLQAGPFCCAGVTVFNSIRNQGLRAGDLVAVHGIGGLGHLGIQFARKLGYEVIAVSSGDDKEQLAKELGAHHYINSTKPDVVGRLQALGNIKLIMCTAPAKESVELLSKALGFNGKLLLLAIMKELTINPLQLISKNQSVVGSYCGDSRDTEDTLKFAANQNIKSMLQVYPLEQVEECLNNISKARFRAVLKIGDF
ncbi:zinc-containing alcohol dehydrogenase [Cavenderia fasciculata]|uniref:Zinc-containing alcohol dehydrogenase n=1 Tax=Cavenderia fasciculata TaxID=261658 RepID=F4PPC9_CACFS|nr:zinc-containing alcohol dehydrogenase [Cavenderia fasciculata]EGG22242.1 zinc-containing alcohol dehydrogenase [Cavenderia fasciculata]|eukprot:XP_004360093.1 zinc-containing alcohol dehydrogenase [Cavenderia fasciculata]